MTEENDFVDFDPRIPKYKPFITRILLTFIFSMFILEILYGAMFNEKAIILLGAKWNPGITNGEYWRFISCAFLHGNLLHLLLNVTALYIFGFEVEAIFGPLRFLLIYLISAWGAGLTSYIFSNGLAIGASGALFGIIGSLIVFFFRQREKIPGANLKFKSMYTLVIINLLLGFLIPRIDNSAHLGGLATGLFTAWFISPEYTLEKNAKTEILSVVKKKDLYRVLSGLFLTITILFWLTKLAIDFQRNHIL